jgi:hypothetical protein
MDKSHVTGGKVLQVLVDDDVLKLTARGEKRREGRPPRAGRFLYLPMWTEDGEFKPEPVTRATTRGRPKP